MLRLRCLVRLFVCCFSFRWLLKMGHAKWDLWWRGLEPLVNRMPEVPVSLRRMGT